VNPVFLASPSNCWRPGADNLPTPVMTSPSLRLTTDANGYYLFFGLPADKYYVQDPHADAPSGHGATTAE
jgi:hypothetical protein